MKHLTDQDLIKFLTADPVSQEHYIKTLRHLARCKACLERLTDFLDVKMKANKEAAEVAGGLLKHIFGAIDSAVNAAAEAVGMPVGGVNEAASETQAKKQFLQFVMWIGRQPDMSFKDLGRIAPAPLFDIEHLAHCESCREQLAALIAYAREIIKQKAPDQKTAMAFMCAHKIFNEAEAWLKEHNTLSTPFNTGEERAFSG